MRNYLLLFAFFICFVSLSQKTKEIPLKSEVDEVTVFVDRAQVVRNKMVQIEPGVSILKFINLSPFILSSSVQARVTGTVTVLSVSHNQDFLEELEKPKSLIDLEKRVEDANYQIDMLNTEIEVMNEEISFLNSNRNIGGNEAISVIALKEATDFYRKRLSQLKTGMLQKAKKISDLKEKVIQLQNQINTISSVKDYANGSILIKVKSNQSSKINIELSYVVENAGWLPFYDIKAKNIDSPISLTYKANIRQDTKVDWENVKIRLSTANPNTSGVQPELETYYLNYSTLPPSYNNNIDQVSGIVFDENKEPLPGVNVVVDGTTIGTVTDFDGRYNITLPNYTRNLTFTYIGYETISKPVTSSNMNVVLKESSQALEEVVVIGYGRQKKSINRELQGKVSGVKIGDGSSPIPLTQIVRQTVVDFEIDLPYTVLSDNKSYSVDIAEYNMQADFKYVSIPKIEQTAFLTARILDWEQYNLIEGEANLFFEDTFVGKTVLDMRFASDTLQLSLGRDENIVVKREKKAVFSSKKFIGSRKEEIRDWKITIKNNKQQEVKLEVYDQIPVSTLDEITVEVLEKSRGKINPDNGEVFWDMDLKPNSIREFSLKYSIKYPKNKRLHIE